ESTTGDGGPIGRREAAECQQHEEAGHPQIEMALAGAQDRVAGDHRLQCATCFHGGLPTVRCLLPHCPRIRGHRHARLHYWLARLDRLTTISVSAVRRASSCFSGHRAAVASRCLAHHSSDMLYRPELAQDASKGATTRNAGSEPRNDEWC